MRRRTFILSLLAIGIAACSPSAAVSAPFEPTRFSVDVRGSGPDVILIPGLTSGPEVWQPTVRAMPDYRYHLIHVAGFAGQPARGNREGAIVSPLADEIARYIIDRRLDRPAIVGHSMGGTLAMLIGARNPSLAGRIMVVDMLPEPAGLFGGSAAGGSPLFDSLRGMVASPGGQRLVAGLLNAFSPPESGARRSDPEVVGRAMHELAGLDLTPHLGRIRAPMTVVYASPDPRAQGSIDRQYAAAYAPARAAHLVRIDGSGHMIMLDQPRRFQTALRAFLGN